jgi:site-specific recombinase XerD
MTSVMPACVKRAKITPHASTHDLRHTFATQMRRQGAPLESIKEILGHKDIADTLIYAHYSMKEAFNVIDLIDKAV